MNSVTRLTAVAALAGLCLLGTGLETASAQTRTARLDGNRLQTMQYLAYYVDEGAEIALEVATESLNTTTARHRLALDALRDFGRRADAFRDKMDRSATTVDVRTEVARLQTQARRVSYRVRRANVPDLAEDWDSVQDDLNRMQRLLAGRNVNVPAPPAFARGIEDDDEDVSRRDDRFGRRDVDVSGTRTTDDVGGFRTTPITGRTLADFRGMVDDLELRANRVFALAQTNQADYSFRGAQMLSDLRHFRDQVVALKARTDNYTLDAREIGPTVDHLLEDARKADTSMRNARVFVEVWNEWADTINTLEKMAASLRR